jgi:glutamate synthase domain-containing protein 3
MENLDKNTEELAKKYAPYLLKRYKANVKHLKAIKEFYRYAESDKQKKILDRDLEITKKQIKEVKEKIYDKINSAYKDKEEDDAKQAIQAYEIEDEEIKRERRKQK